MTKRDLEYLPVGIALPFREAIFHCRCNPPSDWPEQAYVLIGQLNVICPELYVFMIVQVENNFQLVKVVLYCQTCVI